MVQCWRETGPRQSACSQYCNLRFHISRFISFSPSALHKADRGVEGRGGYAGDVWSLGGDNKQLFNKLDKNMDIAPQIRPTPRALHAGGVV